MHTPAKFTPQYSDLIHFSVSFPLQERDGESWCAILVSEITRANSMSNFGAKISYSTDVSEFANKKTTVLL